VSELGFGCGNVGGLLIRGAASEQRQVLARALEAGVSYFDTAPSYGDGRSEESLGRTLTDLGAWNEVVVGTKVTLAPHDLDDPISAVRQSLQNSLKRLGRDHIQLLQLHSRIDGRDERTLIPLDVATKVSDAMRAMVREGLVDHVGITGLGNTASVLEVIRSGAFDTVQAYFNALNPSAGYPGATGGGQNLEGLIDAAAAQGMGVINIRVVAAGALSGSSERARLASPAGGGAMVEGGEFEADLDRAVALVRMASDFGLDGPVELGFRFALAKPGISTVLIGFSDLSQLENALGWAEKGPLEATVVGRIVENARTIA
jgi:aryl-alcohol dehydrogenase-like predicted oxidoreductase